MFGTSLNRAAAYAKVSVETGVSTADPHKLILMLFDGALLAISSAAVAMNSQDIPAKGNHISKAIEIITNGLKVSLDMEAGGELAGRLAALYDYMAERLLYANLRNSRPALDEVAGLLRDLRDAWQQIGQSAA
jgi:flagellar protein FliS